MPAGPGKLNRQIRLPPNPWISFTASRAVTCKRGFSACRLFANADDLPLVMFDTAGKSSVQSTFYPILLPRRRVGLPTLRLQNKGANLSL
jgi:hypothetical protein